MTPIQSELHIAVVPRTRLADYPVGLLLLLPIMALCALMSAGDAPPTAPAVPADLNPYSDPETFYLFIIDDSSSMHQNDRLNLRLQAAQLVLALAHEHDHWAAVRFRQSADVRQEPIKVGGLQERFKHVDALRDVSTSDSPDGTNFVAAFTAAQQVLDRWHGSGRVMAIFLTDGEDINVPNDALSFSVHNLAKKAYRQGANDFQMKIFGIGNAVSPVQLSLIREDSHGSLVQVANAADLIDRVLTLIVQSQNIGRLDPPLPLSFEVGPDVLRIGIIGIGGRGQPGAERGQIGFLKSVVIRREGATENLLENPNCILFPPTDQFLKPENYQIAIAERPPAGVYTIETAGDFQLVDIVLERRLTFLVNPAKPPGRVAENEPFELSVFMLGGGENLQGLAEHTRITAEIFGPFPPKSDSSGRVLNSGKRVGQPVQLRYLPDRHSGRVEFIARVDGLSLASYQAVDGAFTIVFQAVTRENAALTWSRTISSRDMLVERLPGRLKLDLLDPVADFESVDALTKPITVRALNTFQEPLPVLIDIRPARVDQPLPAGLSLPPPLAVILPPGRDVTLAGLPIQIDEEGNLDLIARVYVPTATEFAEAGAQIGRIWQPPVAAADGTPPETTLPENVTPPPAPPTEPWSAMTPEFSKKFMAQLPTNQALAAPDLQAALIRLRFAIGASDRQNFSLTLRRPRIVIEPTRVTLDLDRHPIESLWFKTTDGGLQPRGIFARLPLAPNTRNPVRPVLQPGSIQLRTADGAALDVKFELPETVRIGEQPSLRVLIQPQEGRLGTPVGAQPAPAGLQAGLYTGEADLTLESLERQPLHQAQQVRILFRVELTDPMAFYRTWLPTLTGLALFLLLLFVVVLTRPRFVSHQLRPWIEGRPATRVLPLISFARGWWRHRAAMTPEEPGAFAIRMYGLRRLTRTAAWVQPTTGLPVFLNQTELTAAARLRHGDLITVVTANGPAKYLYFEYIPREEELPRYDGVTAALPGLYLEDGDFLLIDDEPTPQPAGVQQATVLV